MELVAPSGPMYQAGTLSGNPLAMTAGFETLSILKNDNKFYSTLESRCAQLADGVAGNVESLGLPLTMNRVGSMSTLFFTPDRVTDFCSAVKSDTKRFGTYFRKMLESGIYLAPSQYEAGFVSIAHTSDDVAKTVAANKIALQEAFA
jgi:glutamate-1-semialdehyde 2,1-aminomutase